MKITAVETVRVAEFSNIVWVQLRTSDGLVGLGETFRNPDATEAYIHETCAPYLIGKDPLLIDLHWDALHNRVGNHFTGFPTRSVEVRGNSAVDIALWDLFGQSTGLPIHQLLGGLTKDRVRIYNTCAAAAYNARARSEANTLLVGRQQGAAGTLDDLTAQWERPAELAQELLAEGITGLKIWPFDQFAGASRGQYISLSDLKAGVRPFAEIRRAVGDKMDIMHEMHALWAFPAACEIADALEEFGIFWHEDPVPMHDFADLAAFKRRVKPRVCGSEALGTRAWFREAFERGAIDVAHFDLGWVGGITEGKAIAALAQTYGRPVAPHDCTGPVVFAASIHLTLNAPNALIQEAVRAYYRGFYRDIVTEMPRIDDGFVYPITKPGLGMALQPDLLKRPDARIRRTDKI
jgi:L-alanine-DL-glutamate epimerase-like enolase superfamily enzyme